MQHVASYREFGYPDANPAYTAPYLWRVVRALSGHLGPGVRVLDVGCGNGYYAGQFLALGCTVVGVDLSAQGIEQARRAYPAARFEMLAADDALLDRLDVAPFDLVVSTEVIEHLYDPRSFTRGCYAALRPGGRFVCSTPYHGWLKNVAIAVGGGFDRHVSALWDGGHIKFWSRRTLFHLLAEAGFERPRFAGAGRVPYLWKSMVVAAERPLDT